MEGRARKEAAGDSGMPQRGRSCMRNGCIYFSGHVAAVNLSLAPLRGLRVRRESSIIGYAPKASKSPQGGEQKGRGSPRGSLQRLLCVGTKISSSPRESIGRGRSKTGGRALSIQKLER